MGDVTAPFGFPYPEATDLVRDGAADIEALADGVNDQLNLGFQFVGTRYYESSGTFVKADPFGDSSFDGAKLRAIRVRMVGGGSAGGGIASGFPSGGGGGAGAAYAESFITNISGLPTSVTVTRGAGASGGTGVRSAGGTSSFDAIVTAAGGSDEASPQTGAIGGGGGTGDIVIAGQGGGAGSVSTTANGSGGSSHLGGGARGTNDFPADEAGSNAGAFGGGGGGARCQSASTNGGNGANGIVIVDVFS